MKTPCLAALLGLLLVGQAPGKKTIPNHDIADLVLGQPDFTTGTNVGPITSFKSQNPICVLVDPVSRKVFAGEATGDRILRYPNVAALTNGAPAEAVFGTTSFSNGSGGTDAIGLQDPAGLFLDRFGRLWVADSFNNRVVVYEAAAYRGNGPIADFFFGQPDLTTVTPAAAANKMNTPTGVWIDGNDSLWVADSGNNRVLRFASISSKFSGANADGVLGQALFTTSGAGAGTTGLQAPEGIAVSPAGTLYVACRAGNRVMRFNNAAILADGAPANAVLGQPDFNTVTSGLTADKLNFPRGLFLTADDSLWVADSFNHRVVRFSNASTKGAGSAADGVVGQPDFVTNTFAATATGLNFPRGAPFVDATGSLWVADNSNHRVLRFPPDVTRPKLKVTTNVPKSTSDKTINVKGTASDFFGVSQVTFKVNSGSTKTATGTTSWKFKAALRAGDNKITINAVDSVGNKSVSKVLKIERN
jgi:sugar lactone lactonase YvrE